MGVGGYFPYEFLVSWVFGALNVYGLWILYAMAFARIIVGVDELSCTVHWKLFGQTSGGVLGYVGMDCAIGEWLCVWVAFCG